MAEPALPPADILRQLLSYEPETGRLVWRSRERHWFETDRIWKSWNAKLSGREAFAHTDNHGYRRGRLLGRSVKAHIVIWAMISGRTPLQYIDHINHNRSDNRLANLREIPKRENHLNMGQSRANSSGVTGVTRHRGRWQASICVNRKTIYLGRFDEISAAAEARRAAEIKYGFHENHGT